MSRPNSRTVPASEEILRALYGADGSIFLDFRVDILQDGIKAKEVSLAPGGTVSLSADADIKRTCALGLYEPVNLLTDEIRPVMLVRSASGTGISTGTIKSWAQFDALGMSWAELEDAGLIFDSSGAMALEIAHEDPQWAEYPLGIFIPTTQKKVMEGAGVTYQIEAYDRTVILMEDAIDEPLYFAGGTSYLSNIESVLVSAGAASVVVEDEVQTILPASREFDIGTTKMDIINELLAEINFSPIFCDENGNFIIRKAETGTSGEVTHTYEADELSVIKWDTELEDDLYSVPNVFIAVCANPDMDTDLRSVYVNDDENSIFSTVRRGRRIVGEIYQPEQISSQSDLDAYVARQAYLRTQEASETITFITALMPTHGLNDLVQIVHPTAVGLFRETEWEMELSADGAMTHMAKRAVGIYA